MNGGDFSLLKILIVYVAYTHSVRNMEQIVDGQMSWHYHFVSAFFALLGCILGHANDLETSLCVCVCVCVCVCIK